jgi:hypothetical protein
MEKDDDGTLLVYGPAASPDLDRDQQRLNAQWLDQAMPAWFNQGGNVREQHDGKRAVGVGVGLSKADGDMHMLAARIVDPVAVLKCEHGVLKGFSVGIKNPKVTLGKADAPGGEIVGGDIIEVSVVDRPCNPTTLFEIAKADGIGGDLEVVPDAHVTEKSDAEAFGLLPELYDRLAAPVKEALAALASGGATVTAEATKTDDAAPQVTVNVVVQGAVMSEQDLRGEVGKADLSAAGRKKAATSGAAMPDGSYPISTKADLRKAIKAVGRGGTGHDKIRAHVIKRAKALGLEAMVPDNWNPDGSLKEAAKADEPDVAVDAETVAKAEEVLRDARAVAPALAKADDSEAEDIADAQSAIAVIARLIIAEAESLAQGNLNEAIDISLLLDAVRSLTWFKNREEREQNGDGDADMGLSDQPDITKTDTPETPETPDEPAAEPAESAVESTLQTPETPEQPTQGEPEEPGETPKEDEPAASEPPADAVTKADVAELVKAAVAEVTEAAQERETALAAKLTKAEQAIEEFRAMPTPGGPVLTRTSAQQAIARGGDADRLRQEAAALKVKADQVSDRDLRDGYLERAQALLTKADA